MNWQRSVPAALRSQAAANTAEMALQTARCARPYLAGSLRRLQDLMINLRPSGNVPAVIIIGAQKCGTTSLYSYLAEHRAFVPPVRKEVHFFDHNWSRGVEWYQKCFPDVDCQKTFEATPNYLFFPHAAFRVASLLKDIKLIVLVRDPVQRALSHYRYECRRSGELLTFENALAQEGERTDADWARCLKEPAYWPISLHRRSYKRRGLYGQQLSRWLDFFPRQAMFVAEATRLFERSGTGLERLCNFLDIRYYPEQRIPVENFQARSSNSQDFPSSLNEYFVRDQAYLHRSIGLNV